MKAIQLPPQTPEQLQAFEKMYRTTKDGRLRSPVCVKDFETTS